MNVETDPTRHPGRPLIPMDSQLRMEHVEDVGRAPMLIVVLGTVLAFVVCVTGFALGQVGMGVTTGSIGLLAFGAGLSWLAMERRRVRDAERHLGYRARS